MTRRRAATAVAVLMSLASCAPADQASPGDAPAVAGEPRPPTEAFAARVERVVDGDTFIAQRGDERLRVRLIGINAPESVQPDAPVECWGPEASDELDALLPEGAEVRAAYQPRGRTDRFGRELWDVWTEDGRFVQAQLVRRGAALAVAYRPQVRHAPLLDRLESEARQAGRGLFDPAGPCSQ